MIFVDLIFKKLKIKRSFIFNVFLVKEDNEYLVELN